MKIMKLWVAAVATVGLAVLGLPALAGAGIATTAHDFTTKAWNGAGYLCEICHIAHNANETRLIWNHKLATHAGYTWDVTETQAGTTLPTNLLAWAGMSKRCLSCHDGTVAIGDLYFNSQDNVEKATKLVTDAAGTSLQGNHPIGVPYPYNNQASTYNGAPTGVTDFSTYVGAPTGVRLYTDGGGGTVTVGPTAGSTGIECGSCHDAHNDTNGNFLRVDNTASALCTACHIM